jgi:hypothetical protein
MDTLCATFEEWYLGDGTYPPLHKGQKVNLSFYINPVDKTITSNGNYRFEQIKHSDYKFCGKVIRNYTDPHKQIIIIDVGDFKFYIEESDKAFKPLVGQFISGHGTLLLDYYIWVENLRDYPDPPNLFYNFQVERIWKVAIPERFIHRHANGLSSPTSLSPQDYSDKDVQEIVDMRQDHSSTEFYLLNLEFIEEEVAQTFT